MSNSKHTPGPWFDEAPTEFWVRSSATGEHVARTDMDGMTLAQQRANAARIVACVNACEGVDNATLDSLGNLDDLTKQYATLRAQRDALAVLVRAVVDNRHICMIPEDTTAPRELYEWTESARAALAALDGGK